MGNFTERSKLFNAFCILVTFAHGIKLVWNQPLVHRQVGSIPAFNPEIPEQNPGLLSPGPISVTSLSNLPLPSGISSSLSSSNLPSDNDMEVHLTHPVHNPLNRQETSNSLCSIFRTFLDSRSVQCRVSLSNSENLDSNALIQIRNSPSKITNSNLNSNSNARIDDDFNHSTEDMEENGEQKSSSDDVTKIIQDKTTIIVPDHPCPPGQRRDPRGYCRQVLRLRTYNGQQIGVRPVKYYYRRFLAFPALHFILP